MHLCGRIKSPKTVDMNTIQTRPYAIQVIAMQRIYIISNVLQRFAYSQEMHDF